MRRAAIRISSLTFKFPLPNIKETAASSLRQLPRLSRRGFFHAVLCRTLGRTPLAPALPSIFLRSSPIQLQISAHEKNSSCERLLKTTSPIQSRIKVSFRGRFRFLLDTMVLSPQNGRRTALQRSE